MVRRLLARRVELFPIRGGCVHRWLRLGDAHYGSLIARRGQDDVRHAVHMGTMVGGGAMPVARSVRGMTKAVLVAVLAHGPGRLMHRGRESGLMMHLPIPGGSESRLDRCRYSVSINATVTARPTRLLDNMRSNLTCHRPWRRRTSRHPWRPHNSHWVAVPMPMIELRRQGNRQEQARDRGAPDRVPAALLGAS